MVPSLGAAHEKLDDLVANRRDLEEVLLFKSTHTLQLAEDSVVEAGSSKKSHKIEVRTRMHTAAFVTSVAFDGSESALRVGAWRPCPLLAAGIFQGGVTISCGYRKAAGLYSLFAGEA